MMGSMKTGTFGPSDWTNSNSSKISTYTKSKTLAERAAWDFMQNLPASSTMELVTVNPGGVFGPPLGANITGQTMAIVDQMLNGKLPLIPNIAIPMVDVRDLAVLHVQAMITPDAKNKRIIAAASAPSSFADVAQILKDEGFQRAKYTYSTRFLPTFHVIIRSRSKRHARYARYEFKCEQYSNTCNVRLDASLSKTVDTRYRESSASHSRPIKAQSLPEY